MELDEDMQCDEDMEHEVEEAIAVGGRNESRG